MRTPFRLFLLLTPLLCACDPAGDVRVQELPALQRSSLEARLRLPELRGAWRFAGWELGEGDSLGLAAELPSFGILLLQTQKRDSLAGFYLTAGGGRAPLQGEVRRDSVVALVTFPSPGDGRYLVGEVMGDTLWLESTTLADPGSWRGDARAAFVRSRAALTPFRRIRGVFVSAPPPVDSAALAVGMDSLPRSGPGAISPLPSAGAGGGRAGAGAGASAGVRPPAATTGQPSIRPSTPAPTPRAETQPQVPRAVTQPPVSQPVTEPTEEPVVEEEEPEPEPAPPVRREPPRVLGVPVDTVGGQLP